MAATAPWPLDTALLLALEEDPGNVRLESTSRDGFPRMRPLGTVAVGTLSGSILLSDWEVDIFEAFGKTTLVEWTLSFSYRHPRTGEIREAIFGKVPRWTRFKVNGIDSGYSVPLEIRLLP